MKHIVTFLLLLCTSTGYAQWEKVDVPWDGNLYLDVFFLPSNPQHGWICGMNGRVLRTTDGGNTWLGTQIAQAGHLESVHFVSTTEGYVTGPTDRIFKSTNGGISWEDVTPPNSFAMWGCFFLNENEGYVFGGTCNALGDQRYWRTVDGGATWVDTVTNIPSSKLSDGIVYSTGVGYAVGSGELFRTLDSGASWHWFADIGQNVWSEEITNIGSSFLVPFSGSDCDGQTGPNGGMRFSTDNGNNWTSFTTPDHNYGAFLESTTSGWVCGESGQVYYTDDAGATWELRNCGLENDDLDDIWFSGPNIGWVVGTGVYKFVWPPYKADTNQLNFAEICLPGPHVDTVWIHNRDSEEATWSGNLGGSVFSLATSNGTINGCDSVAVEVVCNPEVGFNEAELLVTIIGSAELDIRIDLFAVGRENTLTLAHTDIIDTIDVGIPHNVQLPTYTTSAFNTVTSVVSDASEWLFLQSELPLVVNVDSVLLEFTATFQDTGWFSTEIEILSEPCEGNSTATISMYGLSPIVVVADTAILNLGCGKASVLYVPFANTGNDTLVVSDLVLSGTDASEYALLGWTGSGEMEPGGRDTLIVDISNANPGASDVRIQATTNDLTTARGDKSTITIELQVSLGRPEFAFTESNLEFPQLCVGEPYVFDVGNLVGDDVLLGSMEAFFVGNHPTQLVEPNVNPSPVVPGTTRPIRAEVTPNRSGTFVDTIRLVIAPCDTVFEITYQYEVRGFDVEVGPYTDTVFVGNITEHETQVVSNEDNDIQIVSAGIDNPGLNVQIDQPNLGPKESSLLTMQAQLVDTGWHDIDIRLDLQPCDGQDTGVIRLYGLSPIIQADSPVALNNTPCDTTLTTEFTISNTGNYTLTIATLSLVGADAASCQLSNYGPIEIEPRSNVSLRVTGTNITFPLDCSIIIEHSDTLRALSPESPLAINMVASNGIADLRLVNDFVSFGVLCPGESTTQTVTIQNIGDGIGEFSVSDVSNLTVTQLNGNDGQVGLGESVQLLLRFSSNVPGTFEQQMNVELPCGETLQVDVIGTVLDERFTVAPARIDRTVSSLAPASIPIDIANIGASDVSIVRVEFEPVTPGVSLVAAPTVLAPNDSLRLFLQVDVAFETTISGMVIVESQGVCPDIDTIPVTLRVSEVEYEFSSLAVDFGRVPCRDTVWSQSILLSNLGSEDIRDIRAYALTTTNACSISPTQLPLLEVGNTQQYDVYFDGSQAQPGMYTTRFVIESSDRSVQDTVEVAVEVYSPQVSATSPLHGGYIEYGQEGVVWLEVASDGALPVFVTCASCGPDWNIPTRHDVVNSSEPQYLAIEFTPTTSGTHVVELDVIFGDLCQQARKIELEVQVPYDLLFTVNSHTIDVGERYQLPILVKGDLANIVPGEIDVRMSMQSRSIAAEGMQSPDGVIALSGEPDFIVVTDGFEFTFDPNEVSQHSVLDTAFVVEMQGLASDVGVSDWRFEEASYKGPDSVRIATIDGQHVFSGMCLPIYGFITSIDGVKTSVAGNGSTKPLLRVETKKSENISIIVHDNRGRVVKGMHDIQTSDGMNEFDIANDLASGTYFIEVRYLWLTYTQLLHVVK